MSAIREWIKRNQVNLLMVFAIIFAAILRKSLIYFVSNPDYVCCLKPWYDHILDNGGIQSLESGFSNFPPLYLYFMVITSSVFGDSGYKPYGIKLIPIFFDFLTAYFVYKIVQMKYKDGNLPCFAAISILLAPSLFVVSSFWGQNDILYISFLVVFIYFLLSDKEILSFIALGLAFSIKLQTIFIAPFLFILLLKKKVNWKSFLIIPGVYLISIIPALIVGRPFDELIMLYFDQTQLFSGLLTLNAPSIYAWLRHVVPGGSYIIGSIAGIAILIVLSLVAFKKTKILSKKHLITLAFLSVLITPFLLPKMHERYFLVADVFSILFAFYNPRFFYVPIVMVFSSLLSYIPFLFQADFIPIEQLAIFLGVLILILLFNWRELLLDEA